MTYEEKKKVIDAAIVIREHCTEELGDCKNKECLFHKKDHMLNCVLFTKPKNWMLPKFTRWTPEDIALAKALKAFGAITIKRWATGYITWEDKDGRNGYIPPGSFENLQKSYEISIDTIIKEAER